MNFKFNKGGNMDMKHRNPVKTDQGIFRRDIEGNWWELKIHRVKKQSVKKSSHGYIEASAISGKINDLADIFISNDSLNEGVIIVKGWKRISTSRRIAEIEQSISSSRTILESAQS